MHELQVLLSSLGGGGHSSQSCFVLLAGAKLQDLLPLSAQKKRQGVLVQLLTGMDAVVCRGRRWGAGGGGVGAVLLRLLSVMNAAWCTEEGRGGDAGGGGGVVGPAQKEMQGVLFQLLTAMDAIVSTEEEGGLCCCSC